MIEFSDTTRFTTFIVHLSPSYFPLTPPQVSGDVGTGPPGQGPQLTQ